MTTTTKTSQPLTVLLWVLAAAVAFIFLGAGGTKIIGDPAQVELFERIGVGQWLRYVVGTLEIAGAIGVLIPRLRFLAACGLTAIMVGAVITNLAVTDYSPLVALAFGVLTALLAFGRRREATSFLRRGAVPA